MCPVGPRAVSTRAIAIDLFMIIRSGRHAVKMLGFFFFYRSTENTHCFCFVKCEHIVTSDILDGDNEQEEVEHPQIQPTVTSKN